MEDGSAAAAAAQSLLQNPEFMQMFQRALGANDDGARDALKGMPPEGDPKREQWLKELQTKLQREAMASAKKELEQVHSDEHGQWMYIMPEPGFCLKCTVSGGGKVFINVCQHERIAEPMPITAAAASNVSGAAAVQDDEVQFRIPLSCGQARPDSDKSGKPCKVYDVIVNPATVKRCGEDSEFRRFVAALCMQWIKQKSEPTLNADEFRNLNFKAKGTLESQRIRLSTIQRDKNAMGDEIKLPSMSEASAPSQVGGTSGTGKLIEELGTSVDNKKAVTSASGQQTATGVDERVVLASEGAAAAAGTSGGGAKERAEPSPELGGAAAVLKVEKEGSYDWSTHKKPTLNSFFKEAVPAMYYVEMYIPGVQTIREVEVRVSPKRVECYYVDDDDGEDNSHPFLSVVFDYPISEEITEAKFIKKKAVLKMRFNVQLPDETQQPRTQASRDAVEEEEEEVRLAAEKRRAEWEAQRARMQHQEQAEAEVMSERKSYVENLAAVQSGNLPPMLKSEIDEMPKEQLPAMLQRLEGKVRKGDSIDTLLEKLPGEVLDAVCAYIREKLSLAPLKRNDSNVEEKKKKVHFGGTTSSVSEDSTEPLPSSSAAAKALQQGRMKVAANAANKLETDDGEGSRVEYNYAKKSEKLFGVAFHNRYLFALDN